MRGYDANLTVGERVSWSRRQRGLSQEVVAGRVGRTTDWLSKVENGRVPLDRLSVITQLADVLDVTLGDLIGDPQLMDWSADTQHQTVPALRRALLSYTALLPVAPGSASGPDQAVVERDVADLWDGYQASRFGYVAARLPEVLDSVRSAANLASGHDRSRAWAQLAMTYQAAAATLTKVGESELAWICADRGLAAAEQSENLTVVGSLLRSVAHALLSNSQHDDALAVIDSGVARLLPTANGSTSPQRLSMVGSLLLVAAMAAARSDDAREARSRLASAEQYAVRLGRDHNHLWSAFGPTNVAIHRVSTAMEVGDVQVAADLGPRVDTTGLPVERRVRHSLEVARALTTLNRADEALGVLLAAEQDAPEQIRYHYLSRELVLSWIRAGRNQPTRELRGLAERIRVA